MIWSLYLNHVFRIKLQNQCKSSTYLESTVLELWKCRIGKQEEQSHTSQLHGVQSPVKQNIFFIDLPTVT